MAINKRVTFADTHAGPAGRSTGEKTKTGSSPPAHKATARNLAQFQDMLAEACDDFRRMHVRSEEELAREAVANGDKREAIKRTVHESMKLGGRKTGLALTEMLLAEFKAAVDGEVAAHAERHRREHRKR